MSNILRPPFPTVIDSSLMSSFTSCPYKCKLEYFNHWKPKTPNIHLHAGGAYAHGMEAARKAFYVDERPSAEAVAVGLKALIEFYGDFECPPESAKSLERMCGAFEFYFSQYPLDMDKAVPIHLPDGTRGIEFSFAEPIDVDHPVTGDPLLYVGRLDSLNDFAGGKYGLDDKTTSALGASWPRQWDLRRQFTGYTWGAGRANIKLDGFIIRGISILKTKYDTLQPITYRQAWMIDQWYEQTLRDIRRMIKMWEEGYWDVALDDACNSYGGCTFRQICQTEPENRINWLQTNYERRRWDPVVRSETKLADHEYAEV